MSRWYSKVTRDPNDLTPVLDAYEYFEAEYEEAQKDLDIRGQRLETVQMRIPSIMAHRFAQLQEIEAIMNYLEIRENQKLGERRRHYIEHYNRDLSDRMAEKFAAADDEVVALALLRNQISLVRNKFLAFTKGLESLHYQLGNITKLRAAGMEDAILT